MTARQSWIDRSYCKLATAHSPKAETATIDITIGALVARHTEEREKAQHPLRRIRAMEEQGEAVLITTTDPEMAHLGLG